MIGGLSDLRSAHPQLFSRPIWDELPKGWFDLIDTLCGEIEALLGSEQGRLIVKEIKAKFGELRFYYSLEDSKDVALDIRSLVEAATLRRRPFARNAERQVSAPFWDLGLLPFAKFMRVRRRALHDSDKSPREPRRRI